MTPGECQARIIESLSDNYTDEGVRIWMTSPNKLLGGERAADLVARGEGERVLAVIDSINTGGL